MELRRDSFASSDFLRAAFSSDSLDSLAQVFSKARSPFLTKRGHAELSRILESVLTAEEGSGMTLWYPSPSGKYHFFVKNKFFMLFSISEAILICENPVFYEGDASIMNVRWNEEDHLLLFDDYYIVNPGLTTCICHFSADSNAFFYRTIPTSLRRDEDPIGYKASH